jgi:thiol:disulfide interchange protein DsbD
MSLRRNLAKILIRLAALLAAALIAAPAYAQALNPVSVSARLDPGEVKPGQAAKLLVTAKIDPGWHLYALTQPPPPRAARLTIDETGVFKAAGAAQQPKPRVYQDPNFSTPTEPFMSQTFENEATFTLPIKVLETAQPGAQKIMAKFAYQVCDDHQCLRPTTKTLEVEALIAAATTKPAGAVDKSAEPALAQAGPVSTATPASETPAGSPSPEMAAVAATGSETSPPPAAGVSPDGDRTSDLKNRGLFGFLWFAIIQGFLALLTPCVFPMIPITVSFFTKQQQNGSSAAAVGQASFFSLGIIATYTILGLALATLLGSQGLTQFASNPWLNLLLTALFVLFALNLFGMYEIRVPTGLISKLDARAQRGQSGALFATLLMGITFTLTSLTCTTAFVGTVLIYATTGDWFWAVIGMLAFATAFALPFFFFAMFPKWLSNLPKSGGWLNSVKVVMGFLELAAAFKFLSNVDLVWGWQTVSRNLVLAAWIAITLTTAIYLLGKIQLPHDTAVERLSVVRMLFATVFFAITFYLLTGLFGAPLGELDAWLPPEETNGRMSLLSRGESNRIEWIENYDAAVQKARAENKPVFLNFTGVTCTNCRWMEKNMFPDPRVKKELDSFVLAELFTDRETLQHQAEDERNAERQSKQFNSAALPLYAIISPDERTLAVFPSMTRDKQEFIAFLQRGANNFAQLTARR